MIIGVDGNEANVKDRVGVHQYAFELLWSIYRLKKYWDKKYRFIIFLKEPPNSLLPSPVSGWTYKILPGKNYWILKKLMPALLKEIKMSVFFTPSHYLPPVPFISKVCTIHDLGYLRFSGQFKKYDFWQLRIWTAISIFVSKYIISVSDFTAKDIVRQYPLASKKIFITHHGYDKRRFNNKITPSDVRRILKKYRISKSYILFLSTLKPSKNLSGLIAAFSRIYKKYDLMLVIAGKKGWLYDSVFSQVSQLHLKKRIIFTDFIPEEEKPALIRGAKVLVSPSFWEGFGIHVLEAMACGTPVVVSNIASLPEVAGNAGIYVDPYKIGSITAGIEKVLKMGKKEYNLLIKAGLKQAQIFSWEKTAEKTLDIFDKLPRK